MAVESRTASAAFEHEPLDPTTQEIRLVRILPKENNNQAIHCELERFNLSNEECPKFRALSYTWGLPLPSKAIFLNGKLLEIRENLFNFLKILQELPEMVDFIWIDQLCIDQTNVLERNHQVQFMGQIYSGAFEVIAWIGVTDTQTEDLHERLERRGEHLSTGFNEKAEEFKLLKHLFRRDYWSRLWIVQEIMLARQLVVLCGSMKFRWQSLRIFVSKPMGWPEAVFSLFLYKDLQQHNVKQSFASIVEFCSSHCEDSRDKVYGLQGIIPEEERLEVDYNKTAEEVFCDAVNIMLFAGTLSGILSYKILELGQHMHLQALQSSSCREKLREYVESIKEPSTWIERQDDSSLKFSALCSKNKSTWKKDMLKILEDGKTELQGSKAGNLAGITIQEMEKAAEGVRGKSSRFWTKLGLRAKVGVLSRLSRFGLGTGTIQ